MRIVFLGICILFAAVWISDALKEPARLEEAKLRLATEEKLLSRQNTILLELEAIDNTNVQIFVEDWRRYYMDHPVSSQSISELEIIQAKVKANPDAANEFTLEHNAKQSNKLSEVIESPFFDVSVEAKPGL